MKKIATQALLTAVLAVGFAASAEAAYVGTAAGNISYTIGGPVVSGTALNLQAMTASQSDLNRNINNIAGIGNLHLYNAAIVTGDDTSGDIQNKRPAGVGETDHYLSVYGPNNTINKTGEASFTLDKGTFNTVSFEWGTVDTYNSLTIIDGKDSYTISGADLIAKAGLSQGVSSTYFSITDMDGIKKVILTSTQNAFEVAKVVFSNVPLPAALPLFMAGLAGLGFARSRKMKTA